MGLYYFLWNKFYLILSYNLYESKLSEYFIGIIFLDILMVMGEEIFTVRNNLFVPKGLNKFENYINL